MWSHFVNALRASLFLLPALAATPALAQFVSITSTPTLQDFNTLATSGTSAVLPDGWYLSETGTGANTTYGADDGMLNNGNTYSYGTGTSTERAFGALTSGSVKPIIGAQLRNDTGSVLAEIAISYTGEEWRLGAIGRGADRLDAQYSLNATGVGDTTASWVNVDGLDFSTPNTTGAVGARDGNLATYRTLVAATITGLNVAPTATLWLRWVDLDITGSDDGLAIDDISIGPGGPPVDVPPTVVSTTPADNATSVALASTITVNFSEPVTLATSWFTLSCTVSGSHTGVTSGGTSSYLLTPSPAFSGAETCTFTVLASAVTDLDGTPEPMATDKVITFSTTDPNAPPTLVSITPANGASNVPTAADIRVVFSEAVTTTAGAFGLACNSNPIMLGESGTGANRTLTPATVLPAGATCLFTITGSAVRNGNNIALAGNPSSMFTVFVATPVGAYYNGVDTSTPERLMCTLHVKIRGHTAFPYSNSGATDSWKILELADAAPGDPNKILDVYRNRLYNAVSDRAGTGTGTTYNREHTWPNSLGFPSTTGNLGTPNAPYTDTHMLHLSDTNYNSTRSNSPYKTCAVPASCAEEVTEVNAGFGGGSGMYPGNSNWSTNSGYEVWGHQKGDMARAVMYMAVRYQGGVDPTSGQNEPILRLTDTIGLITGRNNYAQPAYMGVMADLLAWSQADPPDAAEVARNAVIQSFQGNRNPFIDHPEWATTALFNANYIDPSGCPLLSVDAIFANGFDSVPTTVQ